MVALDTPITSSDQSIDRVLKTGLPVLLVFLDGPAPGGLADAMQGLARENAGAFLVVRVQAGENPETTQKYQVGSAPAVVALRDGKVLSKVEQVSAAELQRQAAYLLGKAPRPEPAVQQSAWGAAGTAEPVAITDATFEQRVMKSPRPVLVDFWAPWCGPCRMTDPIVEKLAREMPGRLTVAKINVDENPLVASRYGVTGIPTMMIVKEGRIVDRWSGALPEAHIRSRLQPHLAA